MLQKNFIPAADQDFHAWFEHLTTSLSISACATSDDIAAMQAAQADFKTQTLNATNMAALAKQATSNKTESRLRAEDLIRTVAKRIKAHVDYNAGLGAQLGIIGPRHQQDLAKAHPILKGIDLTGGQVSLSFTKYQSDGINIYCKRDGDLDFVLLARATISPYIDTRPLLQVGIPELRHYCAVYMSKDQEIGHYSDEVIINCTP